MREKSNAKSPGQVLTAVFYNIIKLIFVEENQNQNQTQSSDIDRELLFLRIKKRSKFAVPN